MPISTLHFLSLAYPIPHFLKTLRSQTDLNPITIARVIRWIILPTVIDTEELLARNIEWHILLILPSTTPTLPPVLAALTTVIYTLQAGIPSRLLSSYASKNRALLHPHTSSIPPLLAPSRPSSKRIITPSSQDLSLSPSLKEWIHTFHSREDKEARGAVSMLNFLAFKKGMKEEYLKYGAEFARPGSIAHSLGGVAKIVGTVIPSTTEKAGDGEGQGQWQEIALAHYPSIKHFEDMLGSNEYQDINQRWRVGSLRDTGILMTSEVGIEQYLSPSPPISGSKL